MGDNALLVQIVLGLLAIFFIVTVVFSAKTWRWVQLFFLVLTFGAGITFLIFAAMTLKTHAVWRSAVNTLSKDLKTNVDAKEIIQLGDVTKVQQEPNIRSVKAEMSRVLLDRGRVWRNCSAGNFDGTSVTVGTSPAAADPMAPAKPNNIEVKTILYAFKEIPSADNTMYLPGIYLGEFVATAVTEGSVTLSPTIPLDAYQAQQIRGNAEPWVLYEVLPVDGYEFFPMYPANAAKLNPQELQAKLAENEATLRALILQGTMTQEAWDALIKSYLRTGGPAADDDPPENKWVKVSFKKKKSIDVDNDQPANPGDLQIFDQLGRSIAQRLRRGEAVDFDIGDTAIVDAATAEQWETAGDVEKKEFVYMRSLNDYAKMYQYFFTQREYLADKIALVTRETASIDESTKLAEGHVARGMEEQMKLQQDLANFKLEQEAITDLDKKLQEQSDELRAKLKETYLINQQLAAELAQLQKALDDAIAKEEATKTASLK
jgi:hypothetical protein